MPFYVQAAKGAKIPVLINTHSHKYTHLYKSGSVNI